MIPNPEHFLSKAGINIPLVGFYDAPDSSPFEPLITPTPGKYACVFAYYRQWIKGKTLRLIPENCGCGGASSWLFNKRVRSTEDYISFLCDEEGLKANHELMGQWIGHVKPYQREYTDLFIGPLKDSRYQFLKTVTFFVNPDQLSLMMIASQYYHKAGGPEPVSAKFGAGCMQLVSLFENLKSPQAIIGALDTAMRQYIDPDLIAFTVTKPMYEQICSIGDNSFLNNSFWQKLQKSRATRAGK